MNQINELEAELKKAEAEREELREACKKFVSAWVDRRSIVGDSRMDVAYSYAKRALGWEKSE